jgi:hypothetical protein
VRPRREGVGALSRTSVVGQGIAVGIAVAAVLTVTACRRREAPPPPAEPPRPPPAAPAVRSGPGSTPRTRAEFPTTSGDLALGNLSSQIVGLQGSGPSARGQLIPMLLLRGELLGRIADYQRADQLAREMVSAEPRSPAAFTLRASVDSTLHRFVEEAHDLDRARALGANPAELDGARIGLLEATGRLAEALPLRQRAAEAQPNLANLTALAVLEAERGQLAAAGRLFVQAQDDYRGSSPFPLAYLYLQEGLVAERTGRLGRARDLFAAALDRVPGYAPAASHLAAALASMGQRRRAIALLEPLLHSSDDPEIIGQLAVMLRAEHEGDRAERLFADAERRFEDLLATMPEAFADHAARFYLARGGKAARALALARKNLANRPTREAFGLAIDAALAAGDPRAACQIADRSKAAGPLTPLAQIDAARAFQACNRGSEARALVDQAERALAAP